MSIYKPTQLNLNATIISEESVISDEEFPIPKSASIGQQLIEEAKKMEDEEDKEKKIENVIVVPAYKRDGKCWSKVKEISLFPLRFGVFIKDTNSFVSKISVYGTIILVVVLVTAVEVYFLKIS